MPSGAKKRKAAKKKKVINNNNNGSSTTTNPNQGENEELNSPSLQEPLVEVVKKEDENSSENKLKEINEEQQGNIEIEIGSKSKSSNGSSSSSSDSSDDESNVVEKKVVIESVPVIEESLPENIPPIVEPVIKPVDSLLEQVSQVFDEIKDERKGLVIEETPVVVEEQQTVVVNEIGLKDDCPSSSEVVESVSKETVVETLPKLDEKASLVTDECVESSTLPTELISEVKGEVCANEADTVEHSDDRQAPVASTTLSVQKTTSWKSCCGIFDLFTGSQR